MNSKKTFSFVACHLSPHLWQDLGRYYRSIWTRCARRSSLYWVTPWDHHRLRWLIYLKNTQAHESPPSPLERGHYLHNMYSKYWLTNRMNEKNLLPTPSFIAPGPFSIFLCLGAILPPATLNHQTFFITKHHLYCLLNEFREQKQSRDR